MMDGEILSVLSEDAKPPRAAFSFFAFFCVRSLLASAWPPAAISVVENCAAPFKP